MGSRSRRRDPTYRAPRQVRRKSTGGTIPSRKTPNIFLFLDRDVGRGHGYYDGWVSDHLYYTGHGQEGDQEFRAGNAAVLRHQENENAIRVFRGAGGVVLYLGS
jgi:hypothetical protein